MKSKPKIAITMGDFNGVGPEVVVKALSDPKLRATCCPLIVGSFAVVRSCNERMSKKLKLRRVKSVREAFSSADCVDVLDRVDVQLREIRFGLVAKSAGEAAACSLEKAIELASKRKVDAIATAPVCKEALKLAGYDYPGQTELLAAKTDTEKFAMMLVAGNFRIGLITTHCAVSRVSILISRGKIVEKVSVLNSALKDNFRIENPRIAVCALNPHSGEDGLFGTEEGEIIAPAVAEAQQLKINVCGPFAADTLFAAVDENNYDLYVAMYHDQGLIPIKMKAFYSAVNFTAGLPIIRTSPDHGTAFDIAGKWKADANSMKEAIRLAAKVASHEA